MITAKSISFFLFLNHDHCSGQVCSRLAEILREQASAHCWIKSLRVLSGDSRRLLSHWDFTDYKNNQHFILRKYQDFSITNTIRKAYRRHCVTWWYIYISSTDRLPHQIEYANWYSSHKKTHEKTIVFAVQPLHFICTWCPPWINLEEGAHKIVRCYKKGWRSVLCKFPFSPPFKVYDVF